MLIDEKFTVKSSAKKIYESLLDPKVMGQCIPGCEKVEQTGEKEFDSIIKAKIGIISVKFKVKSIITAAMPPTLICTLSEGDEVRKLGHFVQKSEINFKELSENETEISYHSEVSIVGKLAMFGDRIIKSKAKELGNEFATAVKKILE